MSNDWLVLIALEDPQMVEMPADLLHLAWAPELEINHIPRYSDSPSCLHPLMPMLKDAGIPTDVFLSVRSFWDKTRGVSFRSMNPHIGERYEWEPDLRVSSSARAKHPDWHVQRRTEIVEPTEVIVLSEHSGPLSAMRELQRVQQHLDQWGESPLFNDWWWKHCATDQQRAEREADRDD